MLLWAEMDMGIQCLLGRHILVVKRRAEEYAKWQSHHWQPNRQCRQAWGLLMEQGGDRGLYGTRRTCRKEKACQAIVAENTCSIDVWWYGWWGDRPYERTFYSSVSEGMACWWGVWRRRQEDSGAEYAWPCLHLEQAGINHAPWWQAMLGIVGRQRWQQPN